MIRGLMRDRQRRREADEYQAWLDEHDGEPAGWWPLVGYVIACVALVAAIAWATP